MKKIITLSFALVLGANAYAQQKRVCGTLEHEKFLEQQNPNRAKERADYQKAVQKWIAMRENSTAKTGQSNQTIVQIPLVVHMVYSSTTDSVSDAQIFSQIQILNDDYTRNNADKANTPATFTTAASAPMVNYCWAQRDPAGNPTTGIERRKSTTTSWSTDDKVKHFSTGGLDAWDPSRYFNIWVCALQSPLLGYGEFPTGSLSQTYGFCATYTAFGNTGKAQPPFNKGRTATHEIGHCFNLIHIWGDEPNCTGSDQCTDTPNQASENYNCPAYPHLDACQTLSPGVMFMNYMDYVDDACMNTFTANQSTRMNAVVNSAPYSSLKTSNGCTPLTTVPLDAAISAITTPVGSLGCTGTFIPNVTIKNYGTTTLTSAQIIYKVDNGAPSTYNWSGSLATNASATVALPSVTASAGSHTFTANTNAPNGGSDGNATNDAFSSNFSVSATTGQALPYSEGFEASANLPAGYTLYNPDADVAWAINTTVAKTGTNCMGFNNCDGDGATDMTGRVDRAYTMGFNFAGATTAQMTFDVAYAVLTYSGTPYNDKLDVLVSTNCGSTWTSIYSKTGSVLATAPTYTSIAACWVPTSSQWRNDAINLTPYIGQTNVMFAFENTSDWGTWVYIDNINITETVGIKSEAAAMGIYIYPNPSADGKFKLDIRKNQNDVEKLNIYDMLGNKVYELNQKMNVGQYEMDLSNLASGTYFVEIMKDKPVFTKIVISK